MSPNLILWAVALGIVVAILAAAASGRQTSLIETLRRHVDRRLDRDGSDANPGEATAGESQPSDPPG